jgi:hypothetical protein
MFAKAQRLERHIAEMEVQNSIRENIQFELVGEDMKLPKPAPEPPVSEPVGTSVEVPPPLASVPAPEDS